VSQLKEMLPGIELHHESLDGRGYPYGLKGEQIPLLARVIAVADTFDALTTNRPYQRAYEPEEALRIINNLVGKRLDPEAVAALCTVYARGEIRVRRLVRAQAVPPPATPTQPPAATATAPSELIATPAPVVSPEPSTEVAKAATAATSPSPAQSDPVGTPF
jgi:hypothetical protein